MDNDVSWQAFVRSAYFGPCGYLHSTGSSQLIIDSWDIISSLHCYIGLDFGSFQCLPFSFPYSCRLISLSVAFGIVFGSFRYLPHQQAVQNKQIRAFSFKYNDSLKRVKTIKAKENPEVL